MRELAVHIQKERKAKGLTQEQLAEELGVSRQAVSKWESGQSIPDVDKLAALSRFFGVTADSLLGGPAHSSPPNPAPLPEEAGTEQCPLADRGQQAKRQPFYWFQLAMPWLVFAGILILYFLFWR